MSQGNAGAAVGLANTNKTPMIGAYIQDTIDPNAAVNYAGINALSYWGYNPVDERYDITNGFTVNSTSGVSAGKVARLVYTGASPVVIPADGRCSVSAGGVVTAASGAGLYKAYMPNKTIPTAQYFWVFLI